MSRLSTIQISERTKKELERYSKGKEPYDKIIRRLLRQVKRSSFHAGQKRILRSEKFIPLENV